MPAATAKKKEKPKASIQPAQRIKDIQWQLGEVDPFDLDKPYVPVKKPLKAPASKKKRKTKRSSSHSTTSCTKAMWSMSCLNGQTITSMPALRTRLIISQVIEKVYLGRFPLT